MRRAAEVMEARREEIISWLVRESGSTRLKASLEYESTHAIMLWAASVPDQVEGRILPTDVPGKEGGARRKPVGVCGVISPWNWPLHLSSRSLAPALAVGTWAGLKLFGRLDDAAFRRVVLVLLLISGLSLLVLGR